jgi:hypothetical protein
LKIVLSNHNYGIALSEKALYRLIELGYPKEKLIYIKNYIQDIERNDPRLIQVIEELGDEAGKDKWTTFNILEIPDDVNWEIGWDYYIEDDYNQNQREYIREIRREWHQA